RAADSNRRSDLPGHGFDLARAKGQPMIGASARRRRHRLERVETTHPVALFWTTPCGKVPRVPYGTGSAREEIRIQRHDHIRLLEVVVSLYILAKCQFRPGPRVLPAGWIPLVPSSCGKSCEQLTDLRGKRWRADRLGQDAKSRALARLLGDECRADSA